MTGYSIDIRKRVVAAYEEGENKSEIARRFKISRWTVARYLKRAEAGKLAASVHPGPKPWLNESQCDLLREQINEHKDWTLNQHAEALAEKTNIVLKKSAIDKYCRKLGISYKKRASMPANEMTLNEQSGGKRLAS